MHRPTLTCEGISKAYFLTAVNRRTKSGRELFSYDKHRHPYHRQAVKKAWTSYSTKKNSHLDAKLPSFLLGEMLFRPAQRLTEI